MDFHLTRNRCINLLVSIPKNAVCGSEPKPCNWGFSAASSNYRLLQCEDAPNVRKKGESNLSFLALYLVFFLLTFFFFPVGLLDTIATSNLQFSDFYIYNFVCTRCLNTSSKICPNIAELNRQKGKKIYERMSPFVFFRFFLFSFF